MTSCRRQKIFEKWKMSVRAEKMPQPSSQIKFLAWWNDAINFWKVDKWTGERESGRLWNVQMPRTKSCWHIKLKRALHPQKWTSGVRLNAESIWKDCCEGGNLKVKGQSPATLPSMRRHGANDKGGHSHAEAHFRFACNPESDPFTGN